MLAIIVVLTGSMIALEILINRAVPWFATLNERFPWFRIVFSIGLSLLVGVMFPAGGVMIFGAAIVSTVFMQGYYAWHRVWRETIKPFFTDNIIIVHAGKLVNACTRKPKVSESSVPPPIATPKRSFAERCNEAIKAFSSKSH